MINVSMDFRRAVMESRKFLVDVDIELANGVKLDVGRMDPEDDAIAGGGLSVEDAVSSDGSFDVGAAIINKCALTLNNIYDDFSEHDFTGAKVIPYVGLRLPDGAVERLRKGTFTVDEAKYNGSVIALTCLDNMMKFDRPYSESALTYPATLGQIVRDACERCAVPLRTLTFPHDDFIVPKRPSDEAVTFREVISWAAQIACCFCRCDAYGWLELKWYDQEALETAGLDGGIFDKAGPSAYESGDDADGGSFNPWNEGDEFDGGSFADLKGMHHIQSLFDMDIDVDDVVITGVRALEKAEGEGGDAVTVYQSGRDGYVISVEGNALIQGGAGESVAEWIGERLIGFRFRRASATHLSDPSIEAGDVGFLTDRKGGSYRIVVSNTKFTAGDSQRTSCNAQTPARNGATRYSAETKNYVEYRKALERERAVWEAALGGLADALADESGLYRTEEPQPNGSVIRYFHDKPKLSDSRTVIKVNGRAVGLSTDGGKTYPYGIDFSGRALLEEIYAVGLNAKYINAGALSIKTKAGKETLYADTETGAVRIVADSFSLTSGKTMESIANEQVNNFVSSVYNPKIANLQSQIDGQIETWYCDYEPTLYNAPASSWNTEAERAKHEGDLFYWKSKGYSYRFFKDGGAWKWQLITDSDITKALEEASKAKDTADKKRRVFTSTPYPPYDEGDLWAQGANGDIKVCNVARASGGYVSTDWGLASDYIDSAQAETAANDAAKKAINAQTQTDILNRLTNNGQDKGIYLQNGKLYISFNAARGGELTLGGADNEYGIFRVKNRYNWDLVSFDNSGSMFRIISNASTVENNVYGFPFYKQTFGTSGTSFYRGRISGGEEIESKKIGGLETRNYKTNGIEIVEAELYASGQQRPYAKLSAKDSDGSILSTVQAGNKGVWIDPILAVDCISFVVDPGGSPKINLGSTGIEVTKVLKVNGSFSVSNGTKSKIADTLNYGERLLYCYEMPSPMFGDIGEGETDDAGQCYIYLDDVFSETVTAEIEYQVFLQKEGPGDIWVEKKNSVYFLVKGTENLKFAWEIKAKQKGFEFERLEHYDENPDRQEGIDYESEYMEEMKQLIQEREDVLYETA